MAFPPLIGTAALQDLLPDPSLVVLDASWYLPGSGREARAEYAAGHLPRARFLDLDAASDQQTSLPHMMPPAPQFGEIARACGVSRDSTVVVYDGSDVNLSAARVWWMFRVFGHPRVALLDGGIGRWRREGRPVEAGVPAPPNAGDWEAELRGDPIRTLDDVRRIVSSREAQVVDARPAGRFLAQEPEPREGVRGGHIPGSRSVPYADLVDAEGRMLPPDALLARFHAAGVDLSRPVVATCGSGTSACAILLALEVLGVGGGALYDGAWTEWGSHPDLPVETG